MKQHSTETEVQKRDETRLSQPEICGDLRGHLRPSAFLVNVNVPFAY